MFFYVFVYGIIEETELVCVFVIELPLIAHLKLIFLGVTEIFTIFSIDSERYEKKRYDEVFYFHRKIPKILRRSDFFSLGISSRFFLSQKAPAIIVQRTTLVMSMSIFLIFSFDFFGNIIFYSSISSMCSTLTVLASMMR